MYFERIGGAVTTAKEKVKDHYQGHRELYNAVGTVGTGIGAYFAAMNGLGDLGVQEYIHHGLSNLGVYADPVAHGATSFIAAAGAKVPAKMGVKYLTRNNEKKHGRKEVAEEFGLEGSREVAHEAVDTLASEAAQTGLAHYAIGLPTSISDIKELYHGIRSELRGYRERKAAGKQEDYAAPKTQDGNLDKLLDDMANDVRGTQGGPTGYRVEKAGDYVDRLREGMEGRGYPF